MASEGLLKDKIDKLAEQINLGLLATITNALILTVVLWNFSEKQALLSWIFAIISVSIFRLFLQKKYNKARKNQNNKEIIKWQDYFLVTIFISGFIWGLAGVFLFPSNSIWHQTFIAFVLGGMVAGSTTVYSVILRAFFYFSIPTLLPITIRFFFIDSTIHLAMGIMLIVFWVILSMTAKRLNNEILAYFLLQHERDVLIRDLQIEVGGRRIAQIKLSEKNKEIENIVFQRTEELSNTNQNLLKEISERKFILKALKESEEKFRHLIQFAPAGIFELDADCQKFISVNDVMCQYTEYTEEEFLELEPSKIFSDNSMSKIYDLISLFCEKFENTESYEYEILSKNGNLLSMLGGSKCYFEDGIPRKILTVVHDITELKKIEEEKKDLEAQLNQIQKVESLGVLAGGIAHDFNNLLMAIQGNVSLMLFDMDTKSPYYKKIKNMEEYIEKGVNLTRQLLGVGLKGKYNVKLTDLNYLLKNTSDMFWRTKKELIINSQYQENIWAVEVDRGQFEQVILNLLINSWQAMPYGGDLLLKTENVDLDETFVKNYNLSAGRYVKVSVKDSGIGMDKEAVSKIFDPFFTTKEFGAGTGLGLSSAYGIIKNHNGIIKIFSEVDKGTIVDIYIPACDLPLPVLGKKQDNKEEQNGFSRKGEVILLVDDETMIVEMGVQILENLGFKVLSATSGQETIEIFKDKMDEIDLVILDMIMPQKTGGEVFDAIKLLKPDIKVLLSSGYSINGQAETIMKRGCNGFIQKPYKIEDLFKKIKEILSIK